MKGVEVLVVDAMRYRPHPTHAHLQRALDWIERIRPTRGVFGPISMSIWIMLRSTGRPRNMSGHATTGW